MGGHFSPSNERHALPSEEAAGQRHLGDLGNIRVNESGDGNLEFIIENASLREGADNSLIGRALVVHGGKDQGATMQPSGGSGKPIACGVIEGT
jgi:Cu-Zn family superoxide dismutase